MSDNEILMLSYKEPSRFAELFERHSGRFLAVARKITKSKDLAEDIVQNTFIRIYRHGEKFLAKGGDFKKWSNVILRNCIIDEVSKSKVNNVSLTSEMESVLPGADEHELVESSNYLQSILDRLSVANAQIIKLRFMIGQSFKEIGKILNISSGAARVRVFRAKKEFLEVSEKLNGEITN